MIARQPSGGIAGAALTGQPIVRVTDAVGNIITSGPSSTAPILFEIRAASGTSGAVLSGEGGTRTVNAATGVAQFNDLAINLPGAGYVLRATSAGLTFADSDAFAVRASAVAIQTAPVDSVGGAPLATQPVFQLKNAGGVMNTNTDPVTISIKPGTGTPGATLLGTTTVNAVNGVATFTNLRIDKAGSGWAARNSSTATTNAAMEVFISAAPRP